MELQVQARVRRYGECGEVAKALAVFRSIPHPPSAKSSNLMLAALAQHGQLQRARNLFDEMQERDVVSWNTMISAYARAGDVDQARRLFWTMPQPDTISWNALITANARSGHLQEVLILLNRMRERGAEPNAVTLCAAITACSDPAHLPHAELLHARSVDAGLELHPRVAVSLIAMYSKCGSPQRAFFVFQRMQNPGVVALNAMITAFAHNGQLQPARRLFEAMTERSVVSWNILISAYAQAGLPHEALQLFHRMPSGLADTVTFLGVLDACGHLGSASNAREIHSLIQQQQRQQQQHRQQQQDEEVKLSNAMISMYGSCGCIAEARAAFDDLSAAGRCNLVSWNSLLAAYARNGRRSEAEQLFREMPARDAISWNTIIAASQGECALRRFLTAAPELGAASVLAVLHAGVGELRRVHGFAASLGLTSEVTVGNALVTAYGRCGFIPEARAVFDSAPARDAVTWNAMLAAYVAAARMTEAALLFEAMPAVGEVAVCTMVWGYAQNGQSEAALRLLSVTDAEGVQLGQAGVVAGLHACASLGVAGGAACADIHLGPNGGAAAATVAAALVSTYGRCGRWEAARRVLEEVAPPADVRVLTAMLTAHACAGHVAESRRLFHEDMPEHDVAAWNAMIWALARNVARHEALDCFRVMQRRGVDADEATLTILPEAAGDDADAAAYVAAQVLARGMLASPHVSGAVMNMLTRCGRADVAAALFQRLPPPRPAFVWNSAMAARIGCGGAAATDFLREMLMEGEDASAATMLMLLSACSHGGSLEQARRAFLSMQQDLGFSAMEVHYALMVDLLCRAGKLQEARDLTEAMPYEPDAETWLTLLGGCGAQGAVEAAQGAAAALRASMLDPSSPAPYVLSSNIYKLV